MIVNEIAKFWKSGKRENGYVAWSAPLREEEGKRAEVWNAEAGAVEIRGRVKM